MLFKKILFSLIGFVALFVTFTVQAMSPEEMSHIPGRIVSLGKQVMCEEHLENFLESATSNIQMESQFGQYILRSFPELSAEKHFKAVLTTVQEKVKDKSNPYSRMLTPELMLRLLGISIGETKFSSIGASDSYAQAYDLDIADYGYFQIGYGTLESYMYAQKEESLEEMHSFTDRPGHTSIQNGLESINCLLSSDITFTASFSERTDGARSDSILYRIKSVTRAHLIFEMASQQPNFYEIIQAAKRWTTYMVAVQEMTPEQQKHYFYHDLSQTLESLILQYCTLSPLQLEAINNAKEGKEGYASRVINLINNYGQAYLSAYRAETYFSKDKRTLKNGEDDARYILRKTIVLFNELITNLFSEKSEAERQGLLAYFLSDPANLIYHLKRCFSEETQEANFEDYFWGEHVFPLERYEDLRKTLGIS